MDVTSGSVRDDIVERSAIEAGPPEADLGLNPKRSMAVFLFVRVYGEVILAPALAAEARLSPLARWAA